MSTHQSVSIESLTTAIEVDSGPVANEGAPIGFFAIGIVVNVILICAYFIWAWRQWKKPGTGSKS